MLKKKRKLKIKNFKMILLCDNYVSVDDVLSNPLYIFNLNSISRLQKTQDLLYDSTKDFLQLRYVQRSNERNWMSEKDQLLQQLDKFQECFQKKCSETRFMSSSGAHVLSTCTNTHTAVGVNTGTMAAPNTLAVGHQYFERDDPQVEEEIKVEYCI